MSYKFGDRLKEWTSYVGVAMTGLAYALPLIVPVDSHWVQYWQGLQMLAGAAMIFIPQTAGTTAVENDAWSLLKAFSSQVPPAYAPAMQPLLSTLAAHLARAAAGAPPPVLATQVRAQPVAQPVVEPQPSQGAAPDDVTWPHMPRPMVADPTAALRRS